MYSHCSMKWQDIVLFATFSVPGQAVWDTHSSVVGVFGRCGCFVCSINTVSEWLVQLHSLLLTKCYIITNSNACFIKNFTWFNFVNIIVTSTVSLLTCSSHCLSAWPMDHTHSIIPPVIITLPWLRPFQSPPEWHEHASPSVHTYQPQYTPPMT